MNEVLLEEPVLPQPTDRVLSLTNSGFIDYFSHRNDTIKDLKNEVRIIVLLRNFKQG